MKIINRAMLFVVVPALLATLTTMSMERNYPQLQLQEQTKQNRPIQIDCSVEVFIGKRDRSIAYACQREHDDILNYHHIHSTINDPILPLQITDINGNSTNVMLPVKTCFNLSKGSILQIYEANGFAYNAIYKKKQPLLFNGTCNASFSKDLNSALNKFYIQPSVRINQNSQTELEDAGIITINKEIGSSYPKIRGTYSADGFNCEYDPHWMRILGDRNIFHYFYVEVVKNLVGHGPNGCPNEKRLIETMIAPHVEPYNNSMFHLATAREYGNKKHGRKLQPTTPEEINALFDHYKQLESLEQQFEQKLTLEEK